MQTNNNFHLTSSKLANWTQIYITYYYWYSLIHLPAKLQQDWHQLARYEFYKWMKWRDLHESWVANWSRQVKGNISSSSSSSSSAREVRVASLLLPAATHLYSGTLNLLFKLLWSLPSYLSKKQIACPSCFLIGLLTILASKLLLLLLLLWAPLDLNVSQIGGPKESCNGRFVLPENSKLAPPSS